MTWTRLIVGGSSRGPEVPSRFQFFKYVRESVSDVSSGIPVQHIRCGSRSKLSDIFILSVVVEKQELCYDSL